jgi:ribosomal protein L14E/L6E/L27E
VHLLVNSDELCCFSRAGRVVLINYGPDEGKLATIVDVVDGQRVRVHVAVLEWFSS